MSAHSRPLDGTSSAERVSRSTRAVATPTLRAPTPALQSGFPDPRGRITENAMPPAIHPLAPHRYTMHNMVRQRAADHDTVATAVAICTFVASTALTGNAPASKILDASAMTGVIGVLFAVAAGTFSTNGANLIATRMLLLSRACAVTGAIGIIAGTQSWKVTLLTGMIAVALVGGVLRSVIRRRIGTVDAEVGIPRTFTLR